MAKACCSSSGRRDDGGGGGGGRYTRQMCCQRQGGGGGGGASCLTNSLLVAFIGVKGSTARRARKAFNFSEEAKRENITRCWLPRGGYSIIITIGELPRTWPQPWRIKSISLPW